MCPDHCDALDRRCDVDEKQLREEKPRSLLQVCYHGPFPRRGSWRPSHSFSSRTTHTRSCQREASRCSHPSLWSVTGWGWALEPHPSPGAESSLRPSCPWFSRLVALGCWGPDLPFQRVTATLGRGNPRGMGAGSWVLASTGRVPAPAVWLGESDERL